jgi:hypothetical protein
MVNQISNKYVSSMILMYISNIRAEKDKNEEM